VNRAAYTPNTEAADAYDRLYAEYVRLHDYFGRGGNDVMHRLAALRREGFLATRDEPAGPENGEQA
jgi:L-ribulokinase